MSEHNTVKMIKSRADNSELPRTADVAESEIETWQGWGWILADPEPAKKTRKIKDQEAGE